MMNIFSSYAFKWQLFGEKETVSEYSENVFLRISPHHGHQDIYIASDGQRKRRESDYRSRGQVKYESTCTLKKQQQRQQRQQ